MAYKEMSVCDALENFLWLMKTKCLGSHENVQYYHDILWGRWVYIRPRYRKDT